MDRVPRARFATRTGRAYVGDSYTHPAWRRCGVGGVLARFALTTAHRAGRSTCLAAILPENRVGMAAALRAGYRESGLVGWSGVGALRRFFAHREGEPITWAPQRRRP